MGNEISSFAQATGMSHCIGPPDWSRDVEVMNGGKWRTQLPGEFHQVRSDLKAHAPAPAPVAVRSSARVDQHADDKQSARQRRQSDSATAAAAQASAQGLEVPWLFGGKGGSFNVPAGPGAAAPEGQRTLAPRENGPAPPEYGPAARNKLRQQAPNPMQSCKSTMAAAGSFQARKTGPLGSQAAIYRQSFAGNLGSLESFAAGLPESAAAGQQARQQRNPDGSIYMKLPAGLAPSSDPGLQTGSSFVAPTQEGCGSGGNTRASFASMAGNQGSMAHSRASFAAQHAGGLQRIRE